MNLLMMTCKCLLLQSSLCTDITFENLLKSKFSFTLCNNSAEILLAEILKERFGCHGESSENFLAPAATNAHVRWQLL